jgi:hypothetical protein
VNLILTQDWAQPLGAGQYRAKILEGCYHWYKDQHLQTDKGGFGGV